MRILIRLTCLLLVACSPMLAGAQILPKLAIDSPVVTVPADTLRMMAPFNDSTITYNITLRNIGPGNATGEVDIMFEYNGQPAVPKLTLQLSNFENNMSLDTTIVDTVLPWGIESRYGGTGNIIVIWPRSGSDLISQDPDTSRGDIYILGLVSRDDPEIIRERVQVYPNPANRAVRFLYHKSPARLERVSLLDMQGRTLFEKQGMLAEMPLHQYPNGIYFIHIRYKDGVEGTFKLAVDHTQ